MKRWLQGGSSASEGSDSSSERPAKRGRDEGSSSSGSKMPVNFFSFNVNSLNARCKNGDGRNIAKTILENEYDIVQLQEVKLKSERDGARGVVCEKHKTAVSVFVASLKPHYRLYWSLCHDKGYAGTLTLLHRSLGPVAVRHCLDEEEEEQQDGVKAKVHDHEGRITVITTERLTVLLTYAPNSGMDDQKGLERRAAWDAKMKDFAQRLHAKGMPLVWGGDLNVAPHNVDMSHVAFFKKKNQPGCTDLEQTSLLDIMKHGHLVDAYRFLHPTDHSDSAPSDTPGHTWRGNDKGMYRNMTMRIDLFLVSESLKDQLLECDTEGPSHWAHFMGSDHCPLRLKLKPFPPVASTASREAGMEHAEGEK